MTGTPMDLCQALRDSGSTPRKVLTSSTCGKTLPSWVMSGSFTATAAMSLGLGKPAPGSATAGAPLAPAAARRTAGGFGLARGRSLTRCAGHARAAVEHQWQGTGLLDGLHGLVQHALLAVGDVAGRHLDADHRQALPWAPRLGRPPRQVLRQLLEHQPVVAGVVDAAIGQRQWWRDGARVAALEDGLQVLKQPLVVDARAAHVVVEHALRLFLVHVDGTQEHRPTHDVDADRK